MHYGKPTELVWSHLKRSLANLAKRDIAQLTALAKTRLRRMQYQPGLVEGFLAEPARPHFLLQLPHLRSLASLGGVPLLRPADHCP